MNLPPDYHTHNYLCRHAEGKLTEYAKAALQIGVTEIGFSDHAPMEQDPFDSWRMLRTELPCYLQMLEQARTEYPQLTIRAGLEVDYIPGMESWIKELAGLYDWDYFIGSVHYLDNGWDIDNPEKKELWEKADVDKVWKLYFERLTQAAQSGLFNIIGHCDLVKKFNFLPKSDLSQSYRQFLQAAAQTGTAIEINTSGWDKDCHQAYPSAEILSMAFQEEVALTFGSDAHSPGDVGKNFTNAIKLARHAGYTHSICFERRRPIKTYPLL